MQLFDGLAMQISPFEGSSNYDMCSNLISYAKSWKQKHGVFEIL
jgi:hypothetical protein